MSDTTQRDRSPAFPVIPLEDALERLVQFENHFKRSGARPEKVGDAWGIAAKSYADRIAAAMRYYGLLDYQTQASGRSVVVSEEGRKYLRAQQEETKREIVRAAALRPKQIAKFWDEWGKDRPADPACLDDLTLKNGFSDGGARDFLKVYDATIAYAGLTDSDKAQASATVDASGNEDCDDDRSRHSTQQPVQRTRKAEGMLMEGERELTTGLLSKGASFRLIVSGKIGEKEIERLIRKLQLDKEILAESADDEFRDDYKANEMHT